MAAQHVVENPATKETYGFFARTAQSADVMRMEWAAQPGGEVGEHIHPLQEERFEITSGTLTVSLEGEEATYEQGESVAVPAGKRHFFANRSQAPVTATLELRPALRMQEVFESLAGMARDGKTRSNGLPRNPLLLAVFAHEYADEIRGPRPPAAIQRILLPPLAALGRRLGYVAHRPGYRAELAGRGA